MGHKFERCKMETNDDGSVNIGVTIVATIDDTENPDPAFRTSSEWRRCTTAHEHAWETCDVRTLFAARTKRQAVDAQGKPVVDAKGQSVLEDIPDTSAREQLVAWLQAQRVKRQAARPAQVDLPTRRVEKVVDGKTVEVDEPIKGISLT